ncbi:MAG TPA: zinc-binding alcohol dehydrogenase family protein [Vicinamibacterales bacterium]
MRQVILERPGSFAINDVAAPEAGPGEALVRVRRIGICGTDLHAFAGRQPFFTYPRVLGHELAVTVERIPAGHHGLRPGDHCAVRPFLNDPASRASRRGRPNCCEGLRVLGVHVDGGMQEWLALPCEFLHPGGELLLDALASIEPLSIGCHAVGRGAVTADDEVLVIGAGPIGLATAQFVALTGASLTIVEPAARRRELASALLPEARVLGTLQNEARFDCVFDATGNAAAMMQAFDRVAAGGRLVFVGLTRDPITFDDPSFHRREITLLASRNATPADFERVLAAVRTGQVDAAAWVTHRLALDEVPARFAAVASDPTTVKAIIEVA